MAECSACLRRRAVRVLEARWDQASAAGPSTFPFRGCRRGSACWSWRQLQIRRIEIFPLQTRDAIDGADKPLVCLFAQTSAIGSYGLRLPIEKNEFLVAQGKTLLYAIKSVGIS